jgi:hypothetical protein
MKCGFKNGRGQPSARVFAGKILEEFSSSGTPAGKSLMQCQEWSLGTETWRGGEGV